MNIGNPEISKDIPYVPHPSVKKPLDLIPSYLAAESMRRKANPFVETSGTIASSLEPRLIGVTRNPEEAVKIIGDIGDKDLAAQQAMDLKGEADKIASIRSLLRTNELSSNPAIRERQLRLLFDLDMSAGNIIRRFEGKMQPEAELYRQGTHGIIRGASEDVGSLVDYEESPGQRVKETIRLPNDPRRSEDLGIQRRSLDQILESLPYRLRVGYEYLAALFEKVGNPKVREYLDSLRQLKKPEASGSVF